MQTREAGHSGGFDAFRGPPQTAPDFPGEAFFGSGVGGSGQWVVKTPERGLAPRKGAAQPGEKGARAGGRGAGIALSREPRGEALGDRAPPRVPPESAKEKSARDVLCPARRKGASKVPRRDPERAARALPGRVARQAREGGDPPQSDAKVVKRLARRRTRDAREKRVEARAPFRERRGGSGHEARSVDGEPRYTALPASGQWDQGRGLRGRMRLAPASMTGRSGEG